MAPHCFSIRFHNCNQLEGTGGSVVVRAAGLLERWNFKLELEKQSIYLPRDKMRESKNIESHFRCTYET